MAKLRNALPEQIAGHVYHLAVEADPNAFIQFQKAISWRSPAKIFGEAPWLPVLLTSRHAVP